MSIRFLPTRQDRKSTRLNSSHTVIYTLSLHDALPISIEVDLFIRYPFPVSLLPKDKFFFNQHVHTLSTHSPRSEEHTSELQSHRDLHSFPTRRSSDLHRSRPFHTVSISRLSASKRQVLFQPACPYAFYPLA